MDAFSEPAPRAAARRRPGRLALACGLAGWALTSASAASSAEAGEALAPVVVAYVEDSLDHVLGQRVIAEAYFRLGVDVSFRGFSASEGLQATTSGALDAELQRIDGIDQEYPSLVQVPIPMNFVQMVAFSRRYRFPILGWNSLRPYRIGIVRGILVAEQGTEGMEVRAAADYEELFGWMETDAVDVAALPRTVGLAALRRGGHTQISALEGVLETVFLYHYVHESRRELVAPLRRALHGMLTEGTTLRLRNEAAERLLGSAP